MSLSGILKNTLKVLAAFVTTFVTSTAVHAAVAFPNITVGMTDASTPQEFTQGVQILILLTILTLAPSIFIMTTAFIRIIIVPNRMRPRRTLLRTTAGSSS